MNEQKNGTVIINELVLEMHFVIICQDRKPVLCVGFPLLVLIIAPVMHLLIKRPLACGSELMTVYHDYYMTDCLRPCHVRTYTYNPRAGWPTQGTCQHTREMCKHEDHGNAARGRCNESKNAEESARL